MTEMAYRTVLKRVPNGKGVHLVHTVTVNYHTLPGSGLAFFAERK